MITTRFYLDRRAVKPGKTAPLKISVTKKGDTAYIPLNVSLLPSQWDIKAQKVKDHPRKQFLNVFIAKRKGEVDDAILKLIDKGVLSGLRASQVKDAILAEMSPEEYSLAESKTFAKRFEAFMNTKSGRTQDIYQATYNKVKSFAGKKFEILRFEDITKDWLTRFDTFMSQTSPSKNSRSIHLRNIRTVFNDAIDNDVTSAYPFRKFKIKGEPTRKRAMSVDILRKIFNANLPEWMVKYRDMFKLSFMLIGINVVDLCSLKEIEDGRIYYIRSKTHRQYSIKLEPEAEEIINRYRGKGQLLYMLDTVKNYRMFYNRFTVGLNSIKDIINEEGEVSIKELTTYWARHSWATIASNIGIPKDTIAEALGHGGHTVTDIYIDYDMGLVDEANRKVIDWVLYGKR